MYVILKWKSNVTGERHVWAFPCSNGRTLDDPHFAPGIPLSPAVRREVERVLASPSPPQAIREERGSFTVEEDEFEITTISPHGQIHVEV